MTTQSTVEIGAAYIRVSTNDQTELSPDAQLRVILESAKADGYVIPKEFVYIEKKVFPDAGQTTGKNSNAWWPRPKRSPALSSGFIFGSFHVLLEIRTRVYFIKAFSARNAASRSKVFLNQLQMACLVVSLKVLSNGLTSTTPSTSLERSCVV